MIPTSNELVKMAQIDYQQNQKNTWLNKRDKAYNYYKGRTENYTKNYFSEAQIKEVVCPNVNMTKRIIDRISLVYMKPPRRIYTTTNMNEDMKFEEGIPFYYSKKLKRYVPVKDKNMDTVFLGVESKDGKRTDYIYMDEILRCFKENDNG